MAALNRFARTPAALVWLVVVALGPAAAGCGMFKPDDPQPPDDTNPILADYSSPEATLETLRQAIEAKAFRGGPTAYAGAFSDSSSNPNQPGFLQFFDVGDKIRYEDVSGRPAPEPWYYLLEVNFFQRFINLRSDAYRMDWFPDPDIPDDPPTDPNDSFAEYHRRYLINADSEDGATSQVIAIGIADLSFFRRPEDNHWVIVRWQDRPDFDNYDPDDPEQVTLGYRRMSVP